MFLKLFHENNKIPVMSQARAHFDTELMRWWRLRSNLTTKMDYLQEEDLRKAYNEHVIWKISNTDFCA